MSENPAVELPHDEQGISEATRRLREAEPRLVVLEATGGLETELAASLMAAGLAVVVVNPRQVRDYAKATGQLAKTDRIDALVLADFARAIRPELRPMKDALTRELDDLVTRRRQRAEMRVQESLRLGRASKVQQKSLKSHIAWLDKRIEEIDTDLRQRLRASPAWRTKDDLLRSIPDVGATTSATLLAKLPELGTLDRKGIAALAGLAPLANDSGKQRGQAGHLGRACRGTLRAVHVGAIRCNPVIHAFAQRLKAAGKPAKVVIVACMHKLLSIMNAMLKSNTHPGTLNSLDNKHGCSPISACPRGHRPIARAVIRPTPNGI
jgi:transposase